MNGNRSTALGLGAELPKARPGEVVARATEEHAERFARALLPYIAPPCVPVSELAPAAWRGSDGALTHTGASPALSAASGNAHAEASLGSERVVLNVHSSDLGELSLVLERNSTGVRVLIGVHDPASVARVVPEREALLERLAQSGVRVESVQIMGQRELGTLLAQARTAGSPRTSSGARESVEPGNERTTRRRGSRKLDVVG